MRKHLVNASPRHHVPQRKILMAVPTDSTAMGSPGPVSLPQLAGESAMVFAASWLGSRERRPSAFIQSGQRRLGNQMLAGSRSTSRHDPCAAGGDRSRARAAGSDSGEGRGREAGRDHHNRSVEVVDRLLEAFLVCVPAGASRKPGVLARMS